MATSITTDSIDEIPPELRRIASKSERGQFVVLLPAGWGVGDIDSLRRAAKAERDSRKQFHDVVRQQVQGLLDRMAKAAK